MQFAVKFMQDGSMITGKFEHCGLSPLPSIRVEFPVDALEVTVVEGEYSPGGLLPDDVREFRFASNKGDLAIEPTASIARVRRNLDFNFMLVCWVDGTSFQARIYSIFTTVLKQNE
jgi:hypothetical protein